MSKDWERPVKVRALTGVSGDDSEAGDGLSNEWERVKLDFAAPGVDLLPSSKARRAFMPLARASKGGALRTGDAFLTGCSTESDVRGAAGIGRTSTAPASVVTYMTPSLCSLPSSPALSLLLRGRVSLLPGGRPLRFLSSSLRAARSEGGSLARACSCAYSSASSGVHEARVTCVHVLRFQMSRIVFGDTRYISATMLLLPATALRAGSDVVSGERIM
mmetsp:Transcript_23643/g.45921  ORF Transcript_23643/g.45921 Transcript_23643/m.45921 type:complete len:218 (+) Transcript_23643:1302-1955(+)